MARALVGCLWLMAALPSARSYRVVNQNKTASKHFQPYEEGFVRQYGDPLIFQRERVNEGAPATEDQPRLFEGVHPRQLCPNTVGPLNGVYYCRGKEYGYCDQRSGICFCNMGYSGLGCENCSPTHYQKGELCYPKRLCPNDCSGGGTCDYSTGACQCDVHRSGSDCSQPICTDFDPLCVYCTNSTCMRCLPGYSVSSSNRCYPCTRFDPRCVSCNSQGCLVCGDPLLLSIRRSGRRYADPSLPFDEKTRSLSVAYPFGTQLPEYFDEAEDFGVVSGNDVSAPLNQTSRSCSQGEQGDAHWTCRSFAESHTVCGHKGTLSFSSPTYWVREGRSDFVRITVSRTGGGYGSVSANYSLRHLNTTPSDVVATAHYTTDQTLAFDQGVVQVSFLLRIPDNSRLDGTRAFSLHLTELTGGAVLGPQSAAIVTIADDDTNKTSPWFSYPAGDGLAKVATAGQTSNLTIFARSFSSGGKQQAVGGDFFLVSLENMDDQQLPEGGQARVPYTDGQCRDRGNGSYPCTWMVKQKGRFLLRAFQLVPHGLEGEYFEDAFFGNRAFSRVDHVVNFTWGAGRLTETATDFVSVRWHGRLRANYSETHTFTVSADDHVRLWVDHQLVIDQWDRRVDFSHGKANLTRDAFHHLLLEYRELRETAHIHLWWSSKSTPFQVVPKVNLFRQYELARSPVPVTVRSAATSADMTYCQGPGLTQGVAGEALRFDIHPVDSYGNLRDDSDAVQMAQEGAQYLVEATLVDNRGHGRGSTLVSASSIAYDPERHAYRVEYTPTISGTYSLNVTYQAFRFEPRLAVRGSPFTVTIREARTFAARCLVQGAGLFIGQAGMPQNLTITARDALGNWRHEGGDAIDVIAYNHDRASVAYGDVQDLGNGTYAVTLTPLVQGTYDLALLLRSPGPALSASLASHIASSPYRLYVHPNVAHGPACSAAGPGVVSGVAGYQSEFVVTARDRWGNQLRNSDFNLTVVAVAARRVVGSVLRFSNGTALVVYTPESAGTNYLSVKVAGLSIDGSPFAVHVADGDTRANTSTATGEGLYAAMAGRPASIIVQAKDRYFNLRTLQADADDSASEARRPVFNLTLSSSAGTVLVTNTSSYLSDGRHLLVYNATRAGHFNLTLTDADTGEPLDHSASFRPYVRPAPGSPARSYAYGDGVTTGVAGRVSPVYVQSVDEFGNLLDRGGDVYVASLWGPFHCSIDGCKYNRSTTTQLDARVPASAATLLPLTGAPFNGLLSALSPLHNASSSYPPLDGPSPSASQAVPLSVTDMGNGTYTVPYTAPQSGTYRLQVALGLPGRVWATYYRSLGFDLPYLGQQEPGLNLTWGAYGPSTAHRQGNTSVSTHHLFSLVLRAVLRVPSDGDYRFHVLTDAGADVDLRLANTTILSSSTTITTGPTVTRRSSASSYLLTAGALYSLEVRYQHKRLGAGEPSLVVAWSTPSDQGGAITAIPASALFLFYPVANTTYTPVIVPAPLFPPASTAEGEALTQAVAGSVASFRVFPRDAQGNLLLPSSQPSFTVIGRGPSPSADFLGSAAEANGDGSYNVTYTPLVAGRYSLMVTLGSPPSSEDLGYFNTDESLANAHVAGSPFHLLVSPGALAATACFLTGPGSLAATAGATADLTINPRDAQGNAIVAPLTDQDLARFRARLLLGASSNASTTTVDVALSRSPTGDNTVRGSYNATQAGSYLLAVTLDGKALAAGPTPLTVSPAAAFGPACRVDIDRFPRRNSSASFTVFAVDRWHNRRIGVGGGDRFFVKIFGPEVIYPSVTDQGNGSYTVAYSPRHNGLYNVTVELARPSGLTAAFYSDRTMQGQSVARHVTSQVDYSWGFEPLLPGSSLVHHVGVRWTGLVLAPLNETYRFTTGLEGLDVARVFVAGRLVISHDNQQGGRREVTGSIPLAAGRLYEIVVELEHVAGPCGITLYWETYQTPRQVVPSYYLYASTEALAQSPITIFV